MTKPMVDAVTGKEVQFPGRSMLNSTQKLEDDDCDSEDSLGSDLDNATDEENLKANGADTELDSPPPVYSEEQHFQSMSLLANMDVKSPPIVLQYISPTGPTELEPPFSVTPDLSGPSMCVVRWTHSQR